MFRLISRTIFLILALGAHSAYAAEIVLPIFAECTLQQGRYALSLALSRDNIEGNKRAIFSGSYLGEFDSQAEAASELKPEEKIQDSIKRRGSQISEVSHCLQKKANEMSMPRLTEKKIDIEPYQANTREVSNPSSDNKNADQFNRKIEETEKALKARQWEEAFFHLKYLQKLTQNPTWIQDQNQLASLTQLERLKAQHLPDGLADCHQDWRLVFKNPRQSPYGTRLRHFANKLCLHSDKNFVQRALAGLVLLDHFSETHETELLNGVLHLDLASDEIQLKAIIRYLITLPEAVKVQKVASEAAIIAGSNDSYEWLAREFSKSLQFYGLSDQQRLTVTNLFKEYNE